MRALAALVLAFVCACGSTPAAKTAVQARADARAAVETVESAWLLVAQACVDTYALVPEPMQAKIKSTCEGSLLPARAALLAAADTVDAWTTATTSPTLACQLQGVVKALEAVALVGVTLPSIVVDAETLVLGLVMPGQCVNPAPVADGGAK